MSWKTRVVLSVLTAGLALFLGGIGGFMGPKMPIWTWFGLTTTMALLLLPWNTVVFSQEEMLQEMNDLRSAIDELVELQPKLQELHEELDACGPLKQEELLQVAARFEELKTMPKATQLSLREMLFGNYRRALVVQLIAIAIAGLGGSLMAYQLALWMG